MLLDFIPHLKKQLPLRLLRDAIDKISKNNGVLIMIDSTNDLPDIIRSYSRPFDISLPDERELEEIVVSTLKNIHSKTPIEIGITRTGMDAIIRNLRGLTRRQDEANSFD